MSTRFIRGALILALLTTLTTACDNSGSTNTGSGPTVESSTGAPAVGGSGTGTPAVEGTGTGTPAAEGTGTEPPATGGGGKPAVSYAGGPVGGSTSSNDDGSACVDVSWLGGPDGANLGEGIAFKVTKVRLHNAEQADFPCGEPCAGFTFDSNSDRCNQAVHPGKRDGTLSVTGRILCSATPQKCRDFQSNLKSQSIQIPAADIGGGVIDEHPGSDESTVPQTEPSTPDQQPSSAE